VQDLLELRTGEVQRSEERFRRLFEHNAAVKLMIDPDTGKIIEANKAAADFYGWSIEELRQMRIQEINILTPEAVKNKMELTRLSGAMRLEFRHRRADKSIRDVEVFSSRIEISGRDVLYSTIHDITESKMAKKALEESEKRYRALIDNTQSIVYTIGTDGKLTFVSPSWKILLGHESEEVVGHHFGHFVHEEDVLACRTFLLNTIEKEEMQPSVEYRVFHKDGSLRWHRSNITPVFDECKNLVSLIGNAFDFTDSKQAEEQRIKVEALNRQLQKNYSLQRMAGAIAHTFNNQLGVVIGNLEMAIEDLPWDAKPVMKLTAAMQGAHKAAEVSGLMLTYLGQTTGSHVPLDLSESCRQSLPLLQAGASHGLILKVNLPSPGPTVNANANQIQQVLTNLVTNAWEAVGEKQGTVTLAVKTVPQTDISGVHRYPIDWQAQNATYACLEVADTGCGIANEAIDKIFDPFFSTKFTGRGLGLPVVLGIVKAHDGVVTVESDIGHGSSFRVFLPVSAEEIPRQPDRTTQPLAREGSGTVLLVDDEEILRDMVEIMLTRLGYTVLAAKDGVEAMEMFAQHQDEIRCVLSDVTMPRMDGWQTLTALRRLSPGIPAIFSSGYDEAQVLSGDHPERPQAFLHKPYQIAELQEALMKAIAV
jgi:PAS domain S-box-containing protein